MKCPRCGTEEGKVVDSRSVREGRAVRRRRECLACGERFTTYESLETRPMLVVKRSGERVAYHREKVVVGVTKACEKRPVSLEEIEMIVDQVEHKLAGSGRREVATETIGLTVLEELRQVDEVAYVRFASVYRSFQSVDEFFHLLTDLRRTQESDEADAEETAAPAADAGQAPAVPDPAPQPGAAKKDTRKSPSGRPKTLFDDQEEKS